jgi:hypothetical protein
MNVFVTDYKAEACADQHCHVHRNKMIVEYAQLLSTAHSEWGSWIESMYKPTHVNHPSAIWARATKGNYAWLYNVWLGLMDNYSKHTGKTHKSSRLVDVLKPTLLEPPTFTRDMLAMPDSYKHDNVCIAYRDYLNAKYSEWLGRDKPIKVEWDNRPIWAIV